MSGESLGTSANPLLVNPGTGNLALTANARGVFVVRLSAGNLLTSRITTLSTAAIGATISLGGAAVTLDNVSQFNSNTNDDSFVLTATSGNITLSAGTPLVAAGATLTATGGSILATVGGTQINSAAGGLIPAGSPGHWQLNASRGY